MFPKLCVFFLTIYLCAGFLDKTREGFLSVRFKNHQEVRLEEYQCQRNKNNGL